MKKELDSFQTFELSRFEVDFSKPGPYQAQINHLIPVPHDFRFRLEPSDENQISMDLLRKTQVEIQITDGNEIVYEKILNQGDVINPNYLYDVPFYHTPKGIYYLNFSLLEPPSADSKKAILICYYPFNGIEYIGAGAVSIIGLISIIISVILLAVVFIIHIYLKKRKRREILTQEKPI